VQWAYHQLLPWSAFGRSSPRPGGRDLPVVLGVVVFVSMAILIVNLIVDLIYPLLYPRVGYGSGSHSSNARSKWSRGRAPTTVALGSPPANSITVGNERTP